MNSWGEISQYVESHYLPFVSLAGCLLGSDGKAVAYTVRDARRIVRAASIASIPARFTDPAYLETERAVSRVERSIRRGVR